jgi:hypothetical protein
MIAQPGPVQTNYIRYMGAAQPGMPGSAVAKSTDTRINETAAGVGFGLAVCQGNTDRGALLGCPSGRQFIGVTIADTTLPNVGLPGPDEYQLGDNMAITNLGDWWVPVGDTPSVEPGIEAVYFDAVTGILTPTPTSDTIKIEGARWMTSTKTYIRPTDGVEIAVAMVRLSLIAGNSE